MRIDYVQRQQPGPCAFRLKPGQVPRINPIRQLYDLGNADICHGRSDAKLGKVKRNMGECLFYQHWTTRPYMDHYAMCSAVCLRYRYIWSMTSTI